MGYFFRRSAKIGPFRLNFSKSGIGASVGVTGTRLTLTPRGTTYITVGRHGFYYRETLSNRTGSASGTGQPPQPAVVPGQVPAADEIATADVSDLVDSSSEILIQRLNERAKMFNPAWMLYLGSIAMLVGGLVMFAPAVPEYALPEVTSPLSAERVANAVDEYSAVVTRYGYPNSILASHPLDIVEVRTAYYAPAHVKILFVPDGCVRSYEEAMRKLADRSRKPPLPKKGAQTLTRCSGPPVAGWTIVGYVDPADGASLAADAATTRMGNISAKETSAPSIETESAAGKARSAPKRTIKSSPPTQVSQQTWAVPGHIEQGGQTSDRWGAYSKFGLLLTGLGSFVAGIVVHKKNTEKRTSRLFYELDEAQQQKYSIIQEALNHLGKSHRVWRVDAKSATADWKRNAGASTLIRRSAVGVGVSNPPRVETNLAIRCIDIGTAKMFFLPDVILYLERGTFGGIAYQGFRVDQHVTRFIEDDPVPVDATIVDRTWRYVNRSGGPDRRFNNNIQLPVAQYGVLILTSSQGLNIHLHTSNAQESLAFANCWRTLQGHAQRIEGRQTETPGAPQPLSAVDQALRMLGLSGRTSPDEISAAYRRLAQMYHPDKVAGLASEFQVLADKRMKEINAAYEALKKSQQAGAPG